MNCRKNVFKLLLPLLFLIFNDTLIHAQQNILPGAYQLDQYRSLIFGKKVGLVVNQTSEVNGVLLPDTLLKLGISVKKIFSPEHGFRGNEDAGAKVINGTDPITGLPIISLYGKNKRPSSEQLADLDLVIYDLQDVGVRFYTYISTLQYVMEACGAAHKPLIILDRPNPLGFIVDGPVLMSGFQSFVGMQPIPVIYGMTPGEYAKMLIGEHWLKGTIPELTVIRCANYTHQSHYKLPVAPSPNLKNMAAVYLYPSLCFFEGTVISVGRGTTAPFQQYGHPDLTGFSYQFVPKPQPGASQPLLNGKSCLGEFITSDPIAALDSVENKLEIKWLLKAYQSFPEKTKFFNTFFKNLAGGNQLQTQIQKGMTESEIRQSWEPGLRRFRTIRKKYLLYPE